MISFPRSFYFSSITNRMPNRWGVDATKSVTVRSHSKCPLNAGIICKLELEKQEVPPLACMD